MRERFVHDFQEGSEGMVELLGGKGAGLAAMTRILGPDRVPPGFTVTTRACNSWTKSGGTMPEGLDGEIDRALARLEEATGRRLGDPGRPLLLSVRSGARKSMPGMMDTVLDIGATVEATATIAAETGDPRFAADCRRRLVRMYCDVVSGLPAAELEAALDAELDACGAATEAALEASALERVTARMLDLHLSRLGEPFPEDPRVQLGRAMVAVFSSWMGERAVAYRRIHSIPDDWGTAANIQAMVFGNRAGRSGSGVAFSRDAVSGGPTPSGDFLANAQGEDVVSGTRATMPLSGMEEFAPEAHARLIADLATLERRFGDMQDVEFTVEDGRLWLLQTRTAKRPARASVRFACDAVDEGLLSPGEALLTIDSESLDSLLVPSVAAPLEPGRAIGTGIAASPGACCGEVVLTAADAVAAAAEGRQVVLVRPSTSADDVAGFHSAQGIVTAVGGTASHAALVARGMGRPCVCGVEGLQVDEHTGEARFEAAGVTLAAGDIVTVDGSRGLVAVGRSELVEGGIDPAFARVLGWADDLRVLGVRANADSPSDALRSIELGAEGIGLCRTEHMFTSPERVGPMRRMVLADGPEERDAALAELLPMQQSDFEGILAAMGDRPVTIRLLDPPLHEFLPSPSELQAALDRDHPDGDTGRSDSTLDRVLSLQETNPMLGTRGVRLGLLHPSIHEMQARAIARAVRSIGARDGTVPNVAIMVPLVAWPAELSIVRERLEAVLSEEGIARGAIAIGTMIEIPAACFTTDLIAGSADFFSFGTNDLTQTALGLSRDDSERELLARYLDLGVISRSPFATIDRPTVGALVSMAADRGRTARPGLELGVCGEHGGDPGSIAFFHGLGLDYVSCSPPRIPAARIAAAQAAVAGDGRRTPAATRRISLDPSRPAASAGRTGARA